MGIQSVTDLLIHKKAIELAEIAYSHVVKWSYFDKDTVGKQLIRSLDSIAANIAEGHGRYSFKENKLFCTYARGSLVESQTWLLKAGKRNLIPETEVQKLNTELEVLHKMLNSNIRAIGERYKRTGV